jgi:hypothetical protein
MIKLSFDDDDNDFKSRSGEGRPGRSTEVDEIRLLACHYAPKQL